MKVYLAGPMRGLPEYNFPVFKAAAAKLREQGHEVFSPAERDVAKYGPETIKSDPAEWESGAQKIRDALRADMLWICDEAEAVALLPGWEVSRGADAERALAAALGLVIFYLGDEYTHA